MPDDDPSPINPPGTEHTGPNTWPGPDVGGSVTFDTAAHLRQVNATVPGGATGSDDASLDVGHADHAGELLRPGWIPHFEPEATIDLPEYLREHPHEALPLQLPHEPHGSEGQQPEPQPEPDYGPGDYPEPAPDADTGIA